jgi:hypothetical protein
MLTICLSAQAFTENFNSYSPNTQFLPATNWESRYFNGTAGGDSNWKVIDGGGDTRVLCIGNRGPDDSDCDWTLLYKGEEYNAQQGYTMLWKMYVSYPYGNYSGVICDVTADGTSYNKIDISTNFVVNQWYYYRLYRQGDHVTVWRNTIPFTVSNTGEVIIDKSLPKDDGNYLGFYGVDFALFDDVGFYAGNYNPAPISTGTMFRDDFEAYSQGAFANSDWTGVWCSESIDWLVVPNYSEQCLKYDSADAFQIYQTRNFDRTGGYTLMWQMLVKNSYGQYSGVIYDAASEADFGNRYYNVFNIDAYVANGTLARNTWYYFRLYRLGDMVKIWYSLAPFTVNNMGTLLDSKTVTTDFGDKVGLYGVSEVWFDNLIFSSGDYLPTLDPMASISLENFEGFAANWEIAEPNNQCSLSKQNTVKYEGSYALNLHVNHTANAGYWSRAKGVLAVVQDWTNVKSVTLKVKSSVAGACPTLYWDYLVDGIDDTNRVNGTGGCGSVALASNTEWQTITFDPTVWTRSNVTGIEFYICNDECVTGSFDLYFDDIRVEKVAMPGDANKDGMVDVGDLGILAANYGGTAKAWEQGDFNGDTLVDVGDLGILAANYGSSNFSSDYAKAFGATVTDDNADEEANSSICSGLGLPLIAGLALMGLLLVRWEE